MIIVKLWGGLGNQLFQYSFGKSLSSKLNVELKFDVKTENSSKNFTDRKISLTDFNLKLNLANDYEIKTLKNYNSGYLLRIERKLIQKIPLLNNNYRVESSTKKRIDISKLKDNCYYDGYWQSYKYFENIQDQILREFEFKDAFLDNVSLLKEIENSNSVSIHVRRGDYITIKQNFDRFGICSKKYYESAILYIKKYFADPTFYIFSDDLEWAKENFVGSQYIFISGNNPAEELYLMSNCKHNIIANSTFSWWGAWLNPNKEKIVIAPKKWYNGKLNNSTKELIPETWIRM